MAPIKAALTAFLAKSFSQFSRVRFNAVAPGLLKTPPRLASPAMSTPILCRTGHPSQAPSRPKRPPAWRVFWPPLQRPERPADRRRRRHVDQLLRPRASPPRHAIGVRDRPERSGSRRSVRSTSLLSSARRGPMRSFSPGLPGTAMGDRLCRGPVAWTGLPGTGDLCGSPGDAIPRWPGREGLARSRALRWGSTVHGVFRVVDRSCRLLVEPVVEELGRLFADVASNSTK